MPTTVRSAAAGDSLYRRVAQQMLADIEAGRIRVGEALPPEPELAGRLSVSRHTLREALRILGDLGVVDRRPGAGTIVRAQRPRPAYVQVVHSPEELLQYPPSRLQVRSAQLVRADRVLSRLLQCRTGERWMRVQALRTLRGKRTPICWLDLYLRPEYAGVVASIGKRDEPVYEMVRRLYDEPTVAVTVDLGVAELGAMAADALRARAGDPSFRVVRRYVGRDERVFQVSVSEHVAGRFQYRLQLRYGLNGRGGWVHR
ncbi:MAG: GntR family transcriptional regulator [Proteobacteria bacterium]|nr:GntR family transcriptional regulator [Pseudomonadota bacterium]